MDRLAAATTANSANQQTINAPEYPTNRTPPRLLADTGVITGTLDSIQKAMQIRLDNLHSVPIKNFGQFLVREKSIHAAKQYAKPFQTIAKYTPGINVALGAADFAHAYDHDLKNRDGLRTESTKSFMGTLGNMALGGAAVTIVAATGVATLPAIALVVGAGYAGQEIGEIIGDGVVSIRRWWRG